MYAHYPQPYIWSGFPWTHAQSSFVAMTEAVAEMQERNLRQPCPVANQAEPVEALVDQPLPYPNTRLNSPHAAPGCQDYPELMPMVPERDTVDPALWELSTVPTLLLKEPDMVTKFTSVPLHGSAGACRECAHGNAPRPRQISNGYEFHPLRG